VEKFPCFWPIFLGFSWFLGSDWGLGRLEWERRIEHHRLNSMFPKTIVGWNSVTGKE
jgi:hypothetical protein